MNRFVLEDNDIIILGEKEKNDVGSNNLGGNGFDNWDGSNISNGTPPKSLNGGKGSGNFGHRGRPGMVGGSGDGLASSEARTRSFMYGDTITITSKGKKYTGVLESVSDQRDSEVEVELGNGKKIKIKVQTATLVQEDGKRVDLPWYDAKMVKNVDAVDSLPKDRRTKKQRQALTEVSKMVHINSKEMAYLRNNCSEESAVFLRDELKRAERDGIDLSQVSFAHNARLTRTQGKVVYRPYTTGTKWPPLELQMSVKWLLAGEYYKKKQQKNYDDGWHTSSEIAGILRHEIGHIKSAQTVLRSFDHSREQDGKRVLTSAEVAYRNERFCENLVRGLGYNMYSLSHGSGKQVSDYAVKDRKYSEIIAESYSNPEFSEVTKKVAKALDKEFRKESNEVMMKFDNNMNPDEWEDSLCTGYPMSEEDWNILHDKKPKVYVPEVIKK